MGINIPRIFLQLLPLLLLTFVSTAKPTHVKERGDKNKLSAEF